MEWHVFWTTFITIFLAEIGDKTQFAAVAASSAAKSTTSVLFGVVLALSLAGTLGVLVGKGLTHVVDPKTLQYVSGVLFIIVGAWVLLKR